MGKPGSDSLFSRMFKEPSKKESTFTSLTDSSDVFIRVALELLSNAPATKRNDSLKESIAASFKALDALPKDSQTMMAVFSPFQIACQSKNSELISIAIDCLGKLFTYNFWGQYNLEGLSELAKNPKVSIDSDDTAGIDDGEMTGTAGMISFVIDTISSSYSNVDEKVELQIVKALQAAVSTADPAFCLHGSVLIKAIRTTYNIFLVSNSTNVQAVAQGALTQMVQYVYGRIPKGIQMIGEGPVGQNQRNPKISIDRQLKDAYQVLYTLGKLSTRTVPMPEGTMDLRSQGMRSKLLALHLILTILSSHSYVFLTPCTNIFNQTSSSDASVFIDFAKEHLCLAVSRNAISVVPPVLEVAIDIFGKLMVHLWPFLKKEISVLFTEIVLPVIEAKKQFSFFQRITMIKGLNRLLSDPKINGGKILVEIYLNYDCDLESGARENIWEHLASTIAKAISQHGDTHNSTNISQISSFGHFSGAREFAPEMTTSNLTTFTREQVRDLYSLTGNVDEFRKCAIDLIVNGILKPLTIYCQDRIKYQTAPISDTKSEVINSTDAVHEIDKKNLQELSDDPAAFEEFKHRKRALIEGIKQFNHNPKKGIKYMLDAGCIPNDSPEEIAKFLLKTSGLDKSGIGEYLGEGDEFNISVMHAFVDLMDFTGMKFIDALRYFLQSFRLPGEAQKIDRFMLKFANIYLKYAPDSFSSADTAYVLAYSTIMLNTDQHNSQVKKRMTKIDFLKNNRGIDEGKDLPAELLESIFDEIQSNEIVMKDESMAVKNKLVENDTKNVVQYFANATETMAQKSEALLKTTNPRKGNNFIIANHYKHVKPIFELVWMSFLAALSSVVQGSDDKETISIASDGFKFCLYISCTFDLDLARKTFISTLCKFTSLSHLELIKAKNIEIIKTLLEVVFTEGTAFRDDWKDIVICINNLDKLQTATQNNSVIGFLDSENTKGLKESQDKKGSSNKSGFLMEASAVANSQAMTVLVDRIFTGSVNLSGHSIVSFVSALCEISWEEVSNTAPGLQPRMYCLQRLIEMSFYNMSRIRLEWVNIWAKLGEHFIQVCTFPNATIGFFALDKLRQLAMKFLDLEELSNFKFQKDFLWPFEEILVKTSDPKIKDMVLACIQQMVQAKSKKFRSGWKAIFATLSKSAKESHEPIVILSFDIIKMIYKSSLDDVLANGSLPEFIICVTDLAKNYFYPKTSLHAMELMKLIVPKVAEFEKASSTSKDYHKISHKSMENIHQLFQVSGSKQPHFHAENVESSTSEHSANMEEERSVRYWLPLFYGFLDIVMNGELEVRTRSLNYLFDALKAHGSTFSNEFWLIVANNIIFTIFQDLGGDIMRSKTIGKEEASVWASTTLIQALRYLVELFGARYEQVHFMLKGILEILKACLLQSNETLSRIGATCFQQIIETNLNKLNSQNWDLICDIMEQLVNETVPHAIFFDISDGANGPNPVSKTGRPLLPRPLKKDFELIISVCVQHLLVLQSLSDILNSGADYAVYRSLELKHLNKFLKFFEYSYLFAKEFNDNLEIRSALYQMGFMKNLPNLLKQETSSVSIYLTLLNRMYTDKDESKLLLKDSVEEKILPLDILQNYSNFDPETNRRSVNSWRPVISLILSGLIQFKDSDLKRHIPKLYPCLVGLLSQEVSSDIRLPLMNILLRIGVLLGISQLPSLPPKAETTGTELKEEIDTL